MFLTRIVFSSPFNITEKLSSNSFRLKVIANHSFLALVKMIKAHQVFRIIMKHMKRGGYIKRNKQTKKTREKQNKRKIRKFLMLYK